MFFIDCYWPHPQYHDKYSIYCSNKFFSIDDLIDDGCLTIYINDFTLSKNKSFVQTLILCCNTGVYPQKRDTILASNSVFVF